MQRLARLVPVAALFVAQHTAAAQPAPTAQSCELPNVRRRAVSAGQEGITGRYVSGEAVLYVATCHDSIAVVPAHWSGIEYLTRAKGDSFGVPGRPNRTVVLHAGRTGQVTSVRTTGFGLPERFERVPRARPTAIERLLAGDVTAALSLTYPEADSGRRARAVADQASGFPSKRMLAAELRSRAASLWPPAQAPSRTPEPAASVAAGWSVPFELADLFAPPTLAERDSVRRLVAARDRSVHGARVLLTAPLAIEGDSFSLSVVSYMVGATTLVGALVVPARPAAGCCAVLVDVRGTNSSYTPLDLTRGPAILRLLGSAASAFIVAIPAIRGERLIVGTREFTSEGDRTDGWDGGADDAVALLDASLMLDARADPARSCAYGRSRGGAVALLAAARDRRIRCVIAVSPPTDWFDAMWWNGPPKESIVARVLSARAGPDQPGGQFVERILAPVVAGHWSLADARRMMIASSPLYSADALPPLLAFHGEEDRQVPARNGRVLDSVLVARAGTAQRSFRIVVTPWAGHDADPLRLAREMPRFLARYLGTPVGRRYLGADAR